MLESDKGGLMRPHFRRTHRPVRRPSEPVGQRKPRPSGEAPAGERAHLALADHLAERVARYAERARQNLPLFEEGAS